MTRFSPPVKKWLTHRWTGPFALAATAIAMLFWTWGTYCDPFVDFGREIYVAWRLSAGDVLYRDIDYFNGPFSTYFNALVFRLIGPSLLALELTNLCWWIVLATLSYRLYLLISDALGAFAATLSFILLFSFLKLNPVANYNFMTPYSQEVTHAIVFAFSMLTCLGQFLHSRGWKSLAGCGFFLGLLFLTKIEVMTAAAAALAAGLAADLWTRRATWRTWLKTACVVAIAAMIPAAISLLLLRLAMPWRMAFNGLLGSWKFVGDRALTDNRLYRWLSGRDNLQSNIVRTFFMAGAYVVLLAPAWIVARRTSPNRKSKTLAASLALAAAVALALFLLHDLINWQTCLNGITLVLAVVILSWAVLLFQRARSEVAPADLLRISFVIFALALLAKIFLNVVIFHYGFALTGPAFAAITMLLLTWLPAGIQRAGGTACIFRAAAIAALASFALTNLSVDQSIFRPRITQTIGTGSDAFAADARAATVNEMLNELATRTNPRDTLAAVPTGAMINFLSRRKNPTGEVQLYPGEVMMFGQARILYRFRDHPPDWIVMVPTDVSMFGNRGFGIDYAQDLSRWIAAHYRDVEPSHAISAFSPMHLLKHDPTAHDTKPTSPHATPPPHAERD